MDVQLGEGALHTQLAQAQEQIPIEDPRTAIDVLFFHVHAETQHHGAVSQLLHPQVDRRVQHDVRTLLPDLLQQGREFLLQCLQITGIGDGDVAKGLGHVVGTVEDVPHIRIVYNLDVLAGVGDRGGADAYRSNGNVPYPEKR